MAETRDVRPFAEGLLEIGDVAFGRAWNVRGDPRHEAFTSVVSRVLGVALPAPMTSTRAAGATLLWLGPQSWLHVGDEAATTDECEATRVAVNAAGGALFDVSASYVGWRVSGAAATRVLNRVCPLDLHPRAFAPGRCAQSLIGHVNALFHKPGDGPSFVVMVARSFAADAFHTLREAAHADAYRIAEPSRFSQAGAIPVRRPRADRRAR